MTMSKECSFDEMFPPGSQARRTVEHANELSRRDVIIADLLAALESALSSMDARYTDTGMDLVRQIARAAIKRAKGAA